MAATQKQIDANRRNAQKSTGPRTPEGKARISLNAIKHGLAAGPGTILPHEDGAEYEAMKAGLMESWQPVNYQEVQLVDAIADGWLRVQRALRFEIAMMNLNTRDLKRRRRVPKAPASGDDTAIAVTLGDDTHDLAWNQLHRYRKSAESSYYRAMDHLRKLQNDRIRRDQHRARIAAQQARYVTIRPETASPAVTPQPHVTDSKAPMGSFRTQAPPAAVPVSADSSQACRPIRTSPAS